MRMSTSMIYQQNLSGVTNNQSLWMQSGQQLSSGKRVLYPSDDPLAASQAVMISQSMSENSQYALARTFARQNISMEETVLRSAADGIKDMKTLIVNAGDGTLSDNDRDSLATQLQGLKDQLLSQANSTDGNGRFIFAGFANDKAPFVEQGGKVVYQGSNSAIEQKVDANRTMTVGHTGSSIFMSLTSNIKPEPDGSASETNVFESIDTALKALKTPLQGADEATRAQVTAALDKATRGLDNSYNNVLSTNAVLGTQLQELDVLDSIGIENNTANKNQLTALVEADVVEAISSYYMQQAALQASYKTFSDMQGMSLFQMNR
ncbi:MULTISPECIES: flagellar hook-associated protein FlgL [Serratia]|jgi:flagellar hook-associated protein 3 FlgL|uniref:Flagellar hook-associated protein FlgL n=1 Tax=Serratia fonticola TaxID=47917 RepID=A0AAE7EH57_SERFO|nr:MULTISPECIES: flagellar hook-associated protein FlgL [Serratia]MBC3219835.1 flagellar hook-associated protein FlgL [Serratia fonticola]MBC3229206.1 flagellar hook-associated protein FlgL [Serratia fonticola]MCO7511199.1 flagellar hook-associated protein FlgL [Serratia fonticola]MDQ7212114.1 flagellar hook-associated protein FlgL [Serratia fonticola]MDQ9125662.1 flagellar hook-associated protein FlgL [Serratia fonticola]